SEPAPDHTPEPESHQAVESEPAPAQPAEPESDREADKESSGNLPPLLEWLIADRHEKTESHTNDELPG
ncbi:MAG: hypothetical protein ACR2HF_06580, partial [Methylococcaceae bacterium]